MNPRSALVWVVATAGCVAVAGAQLPSGLSVTGIIPGPGCPSGTSISPVAYGRISIEFSGNGFGAIPNHGRVQCTVQIQATIPAQYQFTTADYKQNNSPANPLQSAEAMISGRLNGAISKGLVEVSWTIPAATPVTLNQSYIYSGPGTFPSASLPLAFPAGTSFPYSACAAQATVRTVSVTIDAAAASDYVMPWPPPAVANNEKFAVQAIRLGIKWQPCPLRQVGSSITP